MKPYASLFAIICAAGMGVANAASPDWVIHPTFDDGVLNVVATPRFVYFTSRTQPYVKGSTQNSKDFQSLFRYDLDSQEVQNLSTDNLLSTNTVSRLDYSPEKGLLVAVGTDHSIDLVYDNGDTGSVPSYRLASIAYEKDVNGVFIDPTSDRVYLATAFGLVAVNDKKREIAESRIYGTPLTGVTRVGDKIVVLKDNLLLAGDAARLPMSIADYATVGEVTGPVALHFVSPTLSVVVANGGSSLLSLTEEGGALRIAPLASGYFGNASRNANGLAIKSDKGLLQINADGSLEEATIPSGMRGTAAATADMREIWVGAGRKGLWSVTRDGDSWSLASQPMIPDAPAPFRASHMVWNDTHGLLVSNHGYDPNFGTDARGGKVLLSAYADGRWTNLSPVFTNPELTEPISDPNGLAVDPKNPDWIYFGSLLYGMERVDLSDAANSIHLSRNNDPFKGDSRFVAIVADQTGGASPLPDIASSWAESCPFAAPEFDSAGNLWTVYADYDDQNPIQLHLICWEAADREATTSAQSIRKPKMVKVKGVVPGNRGIIVPLKSRGHDNWLAYTRRAWSGDLTLIDTAGTPTDPSDDKVVTMSRFVDQDGSAFDVNDIRYIWEDPSTGYLWVGHHGGVFYVNPETMLSGGTNVSRIKVARGDGTNLADYLLDGVPVNAMTTDGAGRKWFATGGAGVVCTSADGRTVVTTLTTESTPLPDDNVYAIGYIPTTNSLMMSTDLGIAEHFLKAAVKADGGDSVRIYPNPVRPEYIGYVTIDGLPDGALVKIVDASGNLVKELQSAIGGEAKWDTTNLAFKQVKSGVYFVMCSSLDKDSGWSNVGKVLVVR